MDQKRRDQVIAFERWRLRFETENATRAQSDAALTLAQTNADSALARLVELGCDRGDELQRAKS